MDEIKESDKIFVDVGPLYDLHVKRIGEDEDETKIYKFGEAPKVVSKLKETGMKMICPTIVLLKFHDLLVSKGRQDALQKLDLVRKLTGILEFVRHEIEDIDEGLRLIKEQDASTTLLDGALASMVNRTQGGRLYTYEDLRFGKMNVSIFKV